MDNREPMICKHCGKPIVDNRPIQDWKHADGFYNCDGYRGHAETYAEPKEDSSGR